jgi:hypothetical protein
MVWRGIGDGHENRRCFKSPEGEEIHDIAQFVAFERQEMIRTDVGRKSMNIGESLMFFLGFRGGHWQLDSRNHWKGHVHTISSSRDYFLSSEPASSSQAHRLCLTKYDTRPPVQETRFKRICRVSQSKRIRGIPNQPKKGCWSLANPNAHERLPQRRLYVVLHHSITREEGFCHDPS